MVFGVMRDRWVHPRSLGTLGCVLRVVEFIWVRWVESGAHTGAPWMSLVSLVCALGDVGFIQGGTRVRARGRRVHPKSLGSLGCALGVVGFIRSHWTHSDATWGLLGSSGVVGFTWECTVWRWVHAGSFGSSGVSL